MADLKTKYGTSTAITTTALATLASSTTAGWQSAAIDNTTDLALGVLITLSVSLAAGSVAADKTVYVYVYE